MRKKPQLQADRLLKLAEYLLSEEANEEIYGIEEVPEYIDHGEFIEETVSFYAQAVTKSLIVFKDEWVLHSNDQAIWKHDKCKTTFTSAMTFYGLTSEQFKHLFIPEYQLLTIFGGTPLDFVAAPWQIGCNIKEMILRVHVALN